MGRGGGFGRKGRGKGSKKGSSTSAWRTDDWKETNWNSWGTSNDWAYDDATAAVVDEGGSSSSRPPSEEPSLHDYGGGASSGAKRRKGADGGAMLDHRDQKCAQCRKFYPASEGEGHGRNFYCAKCCAKWDQQQEVGGAGSWGAGATTTSAAAGQPGWLLQYRSKWKLLIEAEWQEELRLVTDRLKNWPVDRLVRQGYCVTDLDARKRGTFFGKQKIVFSKQLLGKHQFGGGDEVLVSRGWRGQGPLDRSAWKGEVVELRGGSITVVTDDAPGDLRSGVWRLDCGANKTAYDRTVAALGYVTGHKFRATSMRALILGEEGREMGPLDEEGSGAQRYGEDPCSTRPYRLERGAGVFSVSAVDHQHAASREHPSDHLNPSQLAALNAVVSRKLGLIQGPPGTGKTTTTCRLINQLVDAGARGSPPRASCRILVAADSNVAVDQLLAGLVKLGVRAVRVGFPTRVAEELWEHTLLYKVEQHPSQQKIEELRDKLGKVKDDLYGGRLKGKGKGLAHRDISNYVREMQQLEERMTDEILGGAEVVCATLIGCGSDALLKCRWGAMGARVQF